MSDKKAIGRLAPTPSGRMHLGNIFTALLVWLDIRKQGGELILRIEDLDRERCRLEYISQIVDDFTWLGLDWDKGYFDHDSTDYLQSRRTERYEKALHVLSRKEFIYPCYCNRKERMIANAPHASDGTLLYHGRCRTLEIHEIEELEKMGRNKSMRITVPDQYVAFNDNQYGKFEENLTSACGDFILCRSDGVFAYQLAVVVDDGEMGITRVVRGRDLLSSTSRQIWLMEKLGYKIPQYTHVPLLVDSTGRRLSKRDKDLSFDALRKNTTPQKIIGYLAYQIGLIDVLDSITARELLEEFSWEKVGIKDIIIPSEISFLNS